MAKNDKKIYEITASISVLVRAEDFKEAKELASEMIKDKLLSYHNTRIMEPLEIKGKIKYNKADKILLI